MVVVEEEEEEEEEAAAAAEARDGARMSGAMAATAGVALFVNRAVSWYEGRSRFGVATADMGGSSLISFSEVKSPPVAT